MKSLALDFALLTAAMAYAASAHATTCGELGTPASIAIGRIQKHPDVRLFCGPCGDTAATAVRVVSVREVPRRPDQLDLSDASGNVRRVPIRSVYVQLDPNRAVYSSVANYCTNKVVEPDIISPRGAFPLFDEQTVASALASADLKSCASADGSHSIEVRTLFKATGDVVYALALPPYANTALGRCVATQLTRVRVAPFSGGPKAVVQTVTVPGK